MNLKSLEESEDILAVVLFGSTARKDGDAYSDKDVFILCKDMQLEELLKLKHDFISQRIEQVEGICCYRYKDAVLMAEKGSLFLWHLKLQGKAIFSKDGSLEKIFNILKPYENYEKDLDYYSELLGDVKESFMKWNGLSEFDLSILFTIARNTCILLCYRRGIPKFGRSNAYLTAKGVFGEKLPIPNWLYPRLCSWKLWYERGIKTHGELVNELKAGSIIDRVEKLIEFAKGECL
jgi:predicted nucleotidyltransferase